MGRSSQNRSTWANTKLKKLGSKRIDHTAHNYVYLDPDKIRYVMLAFGSLPPKMSSTIAPISLFMALVVASWTTALFLIRFRIKSACPRPQSASAGLLIPFRHGSRHACRSLSSQRACGPAIPASSPLARASFSFSQRR
jgi:hypothetical protein